MFYGSKYANFVKTWKLYNASGLKCIPQQGNDEQYNVAKPAPDIVVTQHSQ